MDRRDLIKRVSLILGGTIIGSDFFIMHGCKTDEKNITNLDSKQIELLDEIAETIIPTTNTPGAKTAKVGAFMALMVKDGYDTKNKKIFLEGIEKLTEACKIKYDKDFLQSNAQQRYELLDMINKEQINVTANQKVDDPAHYFRLIKELTLIGFFTSETGLTKTLRYVAVPGKYDGNVPYKKGDRAWSA